MHYPYDVGKSLMSSFKLPAGVSLAARPLHASAVGALKG
jgi:hypothetical protein